MNDLTELFPGADLSKPLVIAGPCSAETRSQLLETARGLAAGGIKVFRAGLWKPRTHPGGFEGVGAEGLPWLRAVKAETGMYTATEVATRQHVEAAVAAGVDVLWLGARTTANPFAVQEVADAIAASGRDVAVMVKNPVNPDIELWVGALQRIYNAGVRRLVAVHRGFSAYGKHLYRNPPQWRIPIELGRRYPSLPLLCDPSHIGGKRALVASIAQQAYDIGFSGLIVESHCDPDRALSDSAQQVTPAELLAIISSLVVRDRSQSAESLSLLRRQIDQIDDELLELLSQRMRLSREIGLFKKERRMPVIQPDRYNALMNKRVADACELGLSPDFVRGLLAAIHEESVRQQIGE